MRPLVLSIDDEEDVTHLLSYHLQNAGCEVMVASSGEQALQKISERKPDLILLDLMLPDIDGFAVSEILRRDPVTATLPIIILTAWASRDAATLGLEHGVLEFFTKPFVPRDLVRRVMDLLAQRRIADRGELGKRTTASPDWD